MNDYRPKSVAAESFEVDEAGNIVRNVTPLRGRPYQHKCCLEAFDAAACAMEEAGLFTIREIALKTKAPETQIRTAVALLLDRCLIQPRPGHRGELMTADRQIHNLAMIEYCALAEGCPPQHRPPAEGGGR